MSWPKVPFETIYEVSSRNGIYKTKEFHGSGVKIVNMGELFGFEFIGNQEMNRVQVSDVELERDGLVDGDLLFGRRSLVESGAGKCSIVLNPAEPLTFESSIIRVRLDKSKAVPLFYYYWFKSHIGRAGIRAIVSGTNVKGIRGSDLKNVSLALPPIDCQKRIVEVCKNYDDLIENNRRRIQLLEESARLLYKEWFVHLRFPGHEHVKIVDGVPEGWINGCIGTIAEVKSGYAFKSSDWLEEGNPVIKIKNILESFSIDVIDCQCIDDNVAEKASRFELFEGDLLIAMTGATLGKVGLMPKTSQRYYLNQRVGKFTSRSEMNASSFLFCAASTKYFQSQIQNIAGGAAQPNISGGQIESIELLIPERKIFNWFNDSVTPIFKQRQVLLEKNSKLEQARDLLLPRLMNGELTL